MLKYCITASFLLIAASAAAQDNAQAPVTNKTAQALISYDWHDGSKGGVYGIGEGWSIELLAAQYGHETQTYGSRERPVLKLIPAEYKWVKDDDKGLSDDLELETILVTIPAEYMSVTETIVLELAKTEYYFLEAKYNSFGNIVSPTTIARREIPAVTKSVTAQVTKVPATTVERRVPIKRKFGFKRVVKTPIKIVAGKNKVQLPAIRIPRKIEPARFNIKNPNGKIAYSFDNFEDFKVFERSLY